MHQLVRKVAQSEEEYSYKWIVALQYTGLEELCIL